MGLGMPANRHGEEQDGPVVAEQSDAAPRPPAGRDEGSTPTAAPAEGAPPASADRRSSDLSSAEHAGRMRTLSALLVGMIVLDLGYGAMALVAWNDDTRLNLLMGAAFLAASAIGLWLGRRGAVRLAGLIVTVVLLGIEIKEAGERAARLTRRLLAFSKRTPTNPTTVDLNAIVAEMDKLLRRIVGEDIKLVTKLEPRLGKVRIDPSQAEQVLANLAVNARDAMPTGGTLCLTTGIVEVDEQYAQTHLDLAPGEYVTLAVADTGVGMGPEVLAHIFEPFFTTKAEGKGTGLGLATVYGIVKQAGGAVSVYSEPGHGTTFKIYLPVAGGDEESVPASARPLPPQPRKAWTVLVVEDEEAVRKLAIRLLEGHRYRVIAAASGAEAVTLVESRREPIDLLLTDMVMPGMNGVELAKKIASLRPGLPVVFMSGYSDHVLAQNGFVVPGARFVEKPLAKAMLLDAIAAALER
jgi:CheY-like chemotaxis protein